MQKAICDNSNENFKNLNLPVIKIDGNIVFHITRRDKCQVVSNLANML